METKACGITEPDGALIPLCYPTRIHTADNYRLLALATWDKVAPPFIR